MPPDDPLVDRRYKYAHGKTPGTFTAEEWVVAAWNHFIRLPNDTDVTYGWFLLNEIFGGHIRDGSIIVADRIAGPIKHPNEGSCPFCHPRIVDSTFSVYPLTERHGESYCVHAEDIAGIDKIEIGDIIGARSSNGYPSIEGKVRNIYPTRGAVSVYDQKEGGEFLVKGRRIFSHTKPSETEEQNETDTSGSSPKRRRDKKDS